MLHTPGASATTMSEAGGALEEEKASAEAKTSTDANVAEDHELADSQTKNSDLEKTEESTTSSSSLASENAIPVGSKVRLTMTTRDGGQQVEAVVIVEQGQRKYEITGPIGHWKHPHHKNFMLNDKIGIGQDCYKFHSLFRARDEDKHPYRAKDMEAVAAEAGAVDKETHSAGARFKEATAPAEEPAQETLSPNEDLTTTATPKVKATLLDSETHSSNAQSEEPAEVAVVAVKSGTTFFEFLRKTGLPFGCELGLRPNLCRGEDTSTWIRGISNHFNDSEYVGEINSSGMFFVPEAQGRVSFPKNGQRVSSQQHRNDHRTSFTLSNFQLENFTGVYALGSIKVFPVSALVSKECVQPGADGNAKGLSTTNRHQSGVQSGTSRYLNNGTPVYVGPALIVDNPADQPFTYLVVCVSVLSKSAILVSSTSIMPLNKEREYGLSASTERAVSETEKLEYFALMMPILGNGLKNDINTFYCKLTQSCWSGSQNQYYFAPDVKSGRTAIKQKFPGSDESVPKRPSISPKKAAERAAERVADKARKEAEKPSRKREYDCNIESEVLVQKKNGIDAPKSSASDSATAAAALACANATAHMSSLLELSMKAASFSGDSLKQQKSDAISKAETEAAYEKGKIEMLMRQTEIEKEAAYQKGKSEMLMRQTEMQEIRHERQTEMLETRHERQTVMQEGRHERELALCHTQALGNQKHQLMNNQQVMNFTLLQNGNGVLPPLAASEGSLANEALTKDEVFKKFLEGCDLEDFYDGLKRIGVRSSKALKFLSQSTCEKELGMASWQFDMLQDAASKNEK